MASLCHPWFTTTNFSYRFPIFETSATALCGTTGTVEKADDNVAEEEVEDDDGAEDEVNNDVVEDDDVKGEEEDDVEEEEYDNAGNADVEEEEEDRSQDRAAHFVRACAVETHMDISQEPFYAEIYR